MSFTTSNINDFGVRHGATSLSEVWRRVFRRHSKHRNRTRILRLVQCGFHPRQRDGVLRRRTRDEQDVDLGFRQDTEHHDSALFFERTIEKHLGIEDSQVSGELQGSHRGVVGRLGAGTQSPRSTAGARSDGRPTVRCPRMPRTPRGIRRRPGLLRASVLGVCEKGSSKQPGVLAPSREASRTVTRPPYAGTPASETP